MFKVTTRCQWCGTHMPALHVCFFINHTTKYYAPTYAVRTTAENCVKSANVSAVFAPDWLQPPAYQLLCWQSGLTCSSCVAKRKRIFSTPMYCMYHVVGVLHCRGPVNPSELRSPSRYQGGSDDVDQAAQCALRFDPWTTSLVYRILRSRRTSLEYTTHKLLTY